MKTLLLFVLLFAGSTVAFTQTAWIRPDATWHYGFSGVAEYGYVKVRYTGDSLILGQNCQRLEGKIYKFFIINAEGELGMTIGDWGRWYTYENAGKVFYATGDHFEVLYDFSAQTDDSWTINTVGEPAFECDVTSSVKVLETGTMPIGPNGGNIPYLKIEDAENNGYGFTYSPPGENHTRIVAGIGNVESGFLFPRMKNCNDSFFDAYVFNFKCFDDGVLNYNPSGNPCAFFLGTEEDPTVSPLTAQPNPTNSSLYVNIETGNYAYQVVSTDGKLIQQGNLDATNNSIDISAAPSGFYYLKLTDQKTSGTVIRFVKQ